MAYKEFDNKFGKSVGEAITITEHDENAEGVQDEFEERQDAQTVVGVISGFAVTTSDLNTLAIASGDAYAGGKRFSGSDTIDMAASDAAATYYGIVDSSDETTPYDKTTTKPAHDSEDLLLCSFAWDTTTITDLVDLRRWGVEVVSLHSFDPQTVTARRLATFIVDRDMWIEDVQIVQIDNGTAGTTIVDVHAGAAGAARVTIFTTQTRRAELGHATTDSTVATSGEPETSTRKLSAGDIVEVIIDAAATGAEDLGVVIRARYY